MLFSNLKLKAEKKNGETTIEESQRDFKQPLPFGGFLVPAAVLVVSCVFLKNINLTAQISAKVCLGSLAVVPYLITQLTPFRLSFY